MNFDTPTVVRCNVGPGHQAHPIRELYHSMMASGTVDKRLLPPQKPTVPFGCWLLALAGIGLFLTVVFGCLSSISLGRNFQLLQESVAKAAGTSVPKMPDTTPVMLVGATPLIVGGGLYIAFFIRKIIKMPKWQEKNRLYNSLFYCYTHDTVFSPNRKDDKYVGNLDKIQSFLKF